ncbi:MAG: hypothetical protein U0168_29625 [Nannocystaceae bacterium]
MSDRRDPGERFDEDEVGLILARAAEAQAAGRSMTLAELESVAGEAGIDVALVRRAAAEIRARPPAAVTSPAPVGGGAVGLFGPTAWVEERRIEGQLDAAAWEDVVAEIRRNVKLDGGVQQLGKELVWTSHRLHGGGRDVRIIVSTRRGHTLVRVEERAGALAGGLYGGMVGGLSAAGLGWILPVCIAALRAPWLIPLLLPLWIVAAFLLARAIHRTVVAGRRTELRGLADALERTCVELATAVPTPPLPPAP